MATLATLAPLASLVGCALAARPTVWAINESTNAYVVQMSLGESAAPLATWSLPAGASGSMASADGAWVRVLDSATCSLVEAQSMRDHTLISVDQRGRVSFLRQERETELAGELPRTSTCESSEFVQ